MQNDLSNAKIIEQLTCALAPHTCILRVNNDISLDVKVTSATISEVAVNISGVYLPSLRSPVAIEILADEARCRLKIAASEHRRAKGRDQE